MKNPALVYGTVHSVQLLSISGAHSQGTFNTVFMKTITPVCTTVGDSITSDEVIVTGLGIGTPRLKDWMMVLDPLDDFSIINSRGLVQRYTICLFGIESL